MNLIQITQERPDTPDASALINELDTQLQSLYLPEGQYGLSVERLLAQGVAFFVLRYDSSPAGCGGVKFFGKKYAELKRMYIRPNYRGIGLGMKLLAHLESHTKKHRIEIIRLETGIHQKAAIRLYERMGYQQIAAFGDYNKGPLNLFYEKSFKI